MLPDGHYLVRQRMDDWLTVVEILDGLVFITGIAKAFRQRDAIVLYDSWRPLNLLSLKETPIVFP